LDGPLRDGSLPFAGREIPVDDLYQFLINYAGGPARAGLSAFPVLSLVDVLDGTADLSVVRDRLVFVGPWSARFADDRESPTGTLYGVEIHANAAETLLRASFLAPAGPPLTLAFTLLMALLVALFVWRLPPLWAAVASAVLLAAYFVLASELFQRGTVLNLLYPPASLALTFVALTAYQRLFEQARERELQRALSRYLSPAVAREIARDPDRVDLGGELRTMTVLFSDIRGFTTVSEQTPPRELVALLNEYMTAMVEILFKHEGVLDKYMGDGIMAFWSAPVQQPDHARRACRTALDMAAAVARLRESWRVRGLPHLDVGIGLNTGPMVFGNMGCKARTDFTVLGDNVNLAARLEGLTKEYGVRLVVGDATRSATAQEFEYRFLDLVAVKGKSEPTAVYELLAPAGGLTPAREALVAAYHRGIEAYRAQEWSSAARAFAHALALDPVDGPSRLYLDRAEHYVASPPIAWDGVYVATHK
jgi:adenylate cyclase